MSNLHEQITSPDEYSKRLILDIQDRMETKGESIFEAIAAVAELRNIEIDSDFIVKVLPTDMREMIRDEAVKTNLIKKTSANRFKSTLGI